MSSQALNKLTKEWYAKLKKSGFDDIEDSEDTLKRWHTKIFLNASAVSSQAKQDYYRIAGYFLNDYEFKSDYEKKIWELHATGKSMRGIGKQLGKHKKDYVNRIIQRLRKEMLKMYANRSDD